MDTTYNVRVHKIMTYRGQRKTTYIVRWAVDGARKRRPFDTYALADAFRSDLVSATRRGEAFDCATALPVAYRSGASAVTWYDFAVQFCDMQWRRTAGNSRKNTAKALMTATVALLRSEPSDFKPEDVRTALREWAFNTKRRSDAPPEVAAVLKWIERNSLSMAAWEDPAKVDDVVHALSTKLDGTASAASSVKRYRRIMNVVLEYAVKRQVLRTNPLPKGKGTAPKTSLAVDKRSLLNPEQAGALLRWVWHRPRGGRRLHAFFATIYYAGPRPEEAVALRVQDVYLPGEGDADQWGELLLHSAQPEVGKQWTDAGGVHEKRGLKGRAVEDTRPVPLRPALTKILREHVAAAGLKPDDLLFPGEKGEMLAGSVIRRAWRTARLKCLAPHEYASPLGRRVYDLRHTCLTKWLNNGVPPAQVAEWAGNSVPVLLSTYARCISGQTKDLQKRIEDEEEVRHPSADE
ncbi:site-specific integrase [Streptomyces sp. 21So2-11]|uniref:tyrosine-type recombinase/integrase n=1 Tax=Streptomyces sp. 21So2-11 TaxID=3144408 RepID=UPI00321A11B7